jgi:hypothetical protein
MSFNEDNDNQSVLFTPVRFINKHEHGVTSKVAALPAVQKMVVLTPYQADASARAPKLENTRPMGELTKKEDEPAYVQIAEKAKAKAAEDKPPFDEPKKRESKKAAEPAVTAKKNLDSVVAAWTDEE